MSHNNCTFEETTPMAVEPTGNASFRVVLYGLVIPRDAGIRKVQNNDSANRPENLYTTIDDTVCIVHPVI